MNLLFDHNLAHRLALDLQLLYPDFQHVRELGMTTARDESIWNFAREHGMAIVSKDTDFYHRSTAKTSAKSHLDKIGKLLHQPS